MAIKYSNSSLVDYTCISPNKFTSRVSSTYNPTGAITVFTPHHTAGNISVEALGSIFANPARQASANYGIGSDGRLALFVDEAHVAWTSNSFYNDFRAITVEVANDGGPESNWHVSDAAFDKLVKLGVDVCKRNGITKVTYTGDTSGNLTRHNMFIATTCPGGYLESRFPELAQKINAQLSPSPAPTPTPTPTPTTTFKVNDVVKLSKDAVVYGTTTRFADFVYNTNLYVTYVPETGDRIVFSTSKGGPTTGATAAKYLTKVSPAPTPTPTPTPTPKPTPKPTPLPGYTGIITYQAYAGNQWWSEISSANADGTGYNSYAGVIGTPLTALKAKAQYGKIWISVHYLGGSWSKKFDMSNGASAGTIGKAIDAVKIWSETGHVDFQAHTQNGQWWSWIDSRKCDGTDYNSYAGVIGQPIDAIKMK